MTTQYNRIQELEIALEQMVELFEPGGDGYNDTIETYCDSEGFDGALWLEGSVNDKTQEIINNVTKILYSEDYGSDWEEDEE